MSNPQLPEEPSVREVNALACVYEWANKAMENGMPRELIQKILIARGLNQMHAEIFVSTLRSASCEDLEVPKTYKVLKAIKTLKAFKPFKGYESHETFLERAAGVDRMLFGTLVCIGGIVVATITYNAASIGVVYIIAWGAILSGAILIISGLVQTR